MSASPQPLQRWLACLCLLAVALALVPPGVAALTAVGVVAAQAAPAQAAEAPAVPPVIFRATTVKWAGRSTGVGAVDVIFQHSVVESLPKSSGRAVRKVGEDYATVLCAVAQARLLGPVGALGGAAAAVAADDRSLTKAAKGAAVSVVCTDIGKAVAGAVGFGALDTAIRDHSCLRVRVIPSMTASIVLADAYGGADWCRQPVGGSIGVKWMQLGGAAGVLGWATTPELTAPDGAGRFQHFIGGSVYWKPGAPEAYAIYGAIKDRWAQGGWERGLLGYPVTDEFAGAVPGSRVSLFSSGGIYFSPATGAHSVVGAIWQQYSLLGRETGRLGLPTTDEFDLPGGGRQTYFSNGCRIEYRPGTRGPAGLGTWPICNS